MEDYYTATVRTELNRQGIYNHVSAAVPELRWRRAESEADGAHIVSGSNDLGFGITFYLYEDEMNTARVSVSLRSATADESGSVAWQEELRSKLFDEVFPRLEAAVPGDGETGREPGYPTYRSGPGPETPQRPSLPPRPPVAGIDRPSSGRPDRQSTVGQRLKSGAEVVVDLYDWLPGWSEDTVSFRTTDGGPAVVVEYDLGKDPDEGTAEISVVFERAEYFSSYWWPSDGGMFDAGSMSGADVCTVYDVGPSSFLDRCRSDSHRQLGRKRELHHYVVFFHESNMAFEVVAKGLRVE
ncbi:MAG: hypothetical protein ACR2QK_22980 [Acidimicrobiales bacterium]